MQIVYALETPKVISAESLFLAGPSPRKPSHPNWRPEALRLLSKMMFTGTVFIPLPRDGKWAENYDHQVEWELTYLQRALVIPFWIPRNLITLPGYTSNVEFGMFATSGKCVLGFPYDTPKMRYLEKVAKMHRIPICHTLQRTLRTAMMQCQELTEV